VQDYEHIFYLNCPHFTVGHVDQWGEHGYLLYEERVYFYEVDRKDQCDSTCSPMTIAEFLEYASSRSIEIPDEFRAQLSRSGKTDI
jgi:hypothetical protein